MREALIAAIAQIAMPRSVLNAIAAQCVLAFVLLFAAASASAQTMTDEEFRAEIAQRREAAAAIDRASHPVPWAIAQTQLAVGLYNLWDADSMAEANALYRAALEVLTPENAPAEWLVAQEGLGDTLFQFAVSRNLASGFGMLTGSWQDPGVDARDAAQAYRAVLSLRTREDDQLAWGYVQLKLGQALTLWTQQQRFGGLSKAEVDAIESEAESAFRQALDAFTLRENPAFWALAHEGLILLYSQAAWFIGQNYVEDEAALRRSEAERVRYIRAAMASAREAVRGYERGGERERAQDMRQRIERMREDLRPKRRLLEF